MSTANKTYLVAGYSVLKGERKPRFAKNMKREGVLKYHGHTDIQLWELPHPMTKEEATAWLEAGRPGVAEMQQAAEEQQAETPPVVANAVQDAFANAVRAAQAGGDVLTDEEKAAIDEELAEQQLAG